MRRFVLVLLVVFVAGVTPARAQEWCATATLTGQLGNQTVVRSLASGSGVILAGTGPNAQIWRSLDNGASWTLIRAFDGQTDVWGLLSVGNGVFVASMRPSGAIWRSTDNGASWVLAQTITVPQRTAIDTSDRLLFGGGGQIWRSDDDGLTWAFVQSLPSATDVMSFIDLGDRLLAGTAPLGQVFESLDSGLTWALRSSIPQSTVDGLVLAGSDLLAATASGGSGSVYRSVDRGLTWEYLAGGFLGRSAGIATIQSFFVISAPAQLLYSADLSTWNVLVNTTQSHFRSNLQLDPSQVLFGSDGSAQIWRVSAALCPTPTPAPSGTLAPTTPPLPTATFVPVATVELDLSNVISTTSAVMIAQTDAWALDAPTAPLFLGLAFFVFVFGFILIIKRMFTP